MIRGAPDPELSKPTPSGFCLAAGEYFMICPYDPSHQLTNERYMRHVANCRLNYKLKMKKQGKSVEMCVCRYNYTHQLPAPELLSHQERCPDKYNIVRQMAWVKPQEAKKAEEERAKLAKAQAEAEAKRQAQDVVPAEGQVQGLVQGQRQVGAQVKIRGFGRGGGRLPRNKFPNPCEIVPGGYESDSTRTDISTTYSAISSASGAAGDAAGAGKTAKKPPSEAEKSDWEAVRLLDLNKPKPKNK